MPETFDIVCVGVCVGVWVGVCVGWLQGEKYIVTGMDFSWVCTVMISVCSQCRSVLGVRLLTAE